MRDAIMGGWYSDSFSRVFSGWLSISACVALVPAVVFAGEPGRAEHRMGSTNGMMLVGLARDSAHPTRIAHPRNRRPARPVPEKVVSKPARREIMGRISAPSRRAKPMGRGQLGPVVEQFRHLFAGDSVAGVSEWQ